MCVSAHWFCMCNRYRTSNQTKQKKLNKKDIEWDNANAGDTIKMTGMNLMLGKKQTMIPSSIRQMDQSQAMIQTIENFKSQIAFWMITFQYLSTLFLFFYYEQEKILLFFLVCFQNYVKWHFVFITELRMSTLTKQQKLHVFFLVCELWFSFTFDVYFEYTKLCFKCWSLALMFVAVHRTPVMWHLLVVASYTSDVVWMHLFNLFVFLISVTHLTCYFSRVPRIGRHFVIGSLGFAASCMCSVFARGIACLVHVIHVNDDLFSCLFRCTWAYQELAMHFVHA
jgi:hypothetical protein